MIIGDTENIQISYQLGDLYRLVINFEYSSGHYMTHQNVEPGLD